jgi:hypothetical protein
MCTYHGVEFISNSISTLDLVNLGASGVNLIKNAICTEQILDGEVHSHLCVHVSMYAVKS